MRELIAHGNRQLGECLRLLGSYNLRCIINSELSEKGRIIFHIRFRADNKLFEELKMRYAYMIS